MKTGWLVLLWPSLALAWDEEQALAYILAYHPVVTAQHHATVAYQPPKLGRQLLGSVDIHFMQRMEAAR